jgi:putative transposase
VACSYVSHYVHIVFGTKDRVHSIQEEIQPKLWAYMAGIAKGHGIHAVAIGGFADHAHVLIDLGAILGIAKAVQVLKANSSRWMKEHGSARFAWQEGYFACSVSKSQVATIRQYVANQKDHHCRMDFAKEFKLLAEKHGFEIGVEANQQVGCGVP